MAIFIANDVRLSRAPLSWVERRKQVLKAVMENTEDPTWLEFDHNSGEPMSLVRRKGPPMLYDDLNKVFGWRKLQKRPAVINMLLTTMGTHGQGILSVSLRRIHLFSKLRYNPNEAQLDSHDVIRRTVECTITPLPMKNQTTMLNDIDFVTPTHLVRGKWHPSLQEFLRGTDPPPEWETSRGAPQVLHTRSLLPW
ncbi:hypothetical protein DFH29DRAFT_1050171 [Suillus ampliporus]|nr:hypothetical protein DFH29DRAFT_1050171 [Suillus ampliporus]